MKLLKKADNILGLALRIICTGSMIGIFLLYIANVIIRFIPVVNFTATDEIVEMLTGWVIFFGAAALQRERNHFSLDFVKKKYEDRAAGKLINIFVYLISMIFILVLVYYGMDLCGRSNSLSTTLRIPKKMFYACIPISAAIMGIYLTRDVVNHVVALFKPNLKES